MELHHRLQHGEGFESLTTDWGNGFGVKGRIGDFDLYNRFLFEVQAPIGLQVILQIAGTYQILIVHEPERQ